MIPIPSPLLIGFWGGLLFVLLACLPWLKNARAQLIVSGAFLGLTCGTIWGAPRAWAALRVRFETAFWIMEHWGELESGTRTGILIMVFGTLAVAGLFMFLAYTFVWRSMFQDLVRVDEAGALTRYGRVYRVKQTKDKQTGEEQWVVSFRYDGHWTPPWRMERLVCQEEPELVGVFKLGVRASRFEQSEPFTWQAIPTDAPDAVLGTTRVRVGDFMEWEVTDLEWKEELAKKGAHGHLFTQRKKILLSRLDATFLRPGSMEAKRPASQVIPEMMRPTTELDRIMSLSDEAPTRSIRPGSNGAHAEEPE